MSTDSGRPDHDRATSSRAMRALLDRPMTEAAMDENTSLVAQPPVRSETDGLDLLVVRVGDELLGLGATLVHRVHEPAVPRRVPHRHAKHLSGIVAVDGEIVPAGILSRLLELERGRGPTSPRLVLVGPTDRRWALPVDEAIGIRRIPRDAMLGAPTAGSAAWTGHVSGLARISEGVVAIIDGDRLLDSLDGGLR